MVNEPKTNTTIEIGEATESYGAVIPPIYFLSSLSTPKQVNWVGNIYQRCA